MTLAVVELHEIRTDTTNWDTKVRCTCGEFESASKCEQYKHAAEALRSRLVSTFDVYAECADDTEDR